MKNKIVLIVGRFQPFHKGHLFLIKKALLKADKIVIGIGSANIIDMNNPIDYETRRKIVRAVFYKEGLEEKLTKIVPLDDFFDDQKWLGNVKKMVGKFDLVVGQNNWVNRIMKKSGTKVLTCQYYKRNLYEGWRIRKLIKEGKKWQDRVPKYLVDFIKSYKLQVTSYIRVVLGGTFDHFHAGHKALISKALEIGKNITIGIATEELYRNKFLSQTIQFYSDRYKIVKTFTTKYLMNDRSVDIISFSEFTGGLDKKIEVDAIVVSRETFPNALKINELRNKNHLKPLMIVIIENVLAEDGKIISSERIRAGEIDKNGKLFELPTNHQPSLKLRPASQSLITNHSLKMPESLRPMLQKPLGKVFNDTKSLLHYINIMKWTMIIAVGDIIVDSLLKENVHPDIKIIDNRSRRQPITFKQCNIDTAVQELYTNKPGTINLKTAEKLRELIRDAVSSPRRRGSRNSWLVIDGEEDLLTLPAILFSPLNSLVLYGHWQYGIIAVEVDEKIKNMIRKIIEKFII